MADETDHGIEARVPSDPSDLARHPTEASEAASPGRTDAVSSGIVGTHDGAELAGGRKAHADGAGAARGQGGTRKPGEPSPTAGEDPGALQSRAHLKAALADKAAAELDEESEELEGSHDLKRGADSASALSKRIRAKGRPHGSDGIAHGGAEAGTPKGAGGSGGPAEASERIRERRAWTASRAAAAEASAAEGAAAATTAEAGSGGMLATIGSALAPIAGVLAGIAAFALAALVISQVLSALFGFWENEATRDAGELTGVERQIAEELKGYGFSDAAIAGILGNLACEGGFDPSSDVVMDGMFNYAYERACGIFQYTSTSPGTGEYWAFKRWCSSSGKTWSTVEAQMEWTFSGKHSGTWSGRWSMALARSGYYSNCPGYKGIGAYTASQYKEASDVDKAAYSWMACYERPANGSYAHLDRRISEAERYYALLTSDSESYSVSNKIVAAAYSQLGVPYVWGGSTPGKALDCSGLTQYCYAQAGIKIAHYTETQYAQLKKVPLSQARPGDILYRPGHVAIYIGGDEYIHEPHTGDVCRKATGISYFTCALSARADNAHYR